MKSLIQNNPSLSSSTLTNLSKEFDHIWIVNHFEQLIERYTSKNCFLSNEFKSKRLEPLPDTANDGNTDYSWRLRLYPNGDSSNNNSISIFIEAYQTEYEKLNEIESRELKYRLDLYKLVDHEVKHIHYKGSNSLIWNLEDMKPWGFSKFVPRDQIFDNRDKIQELHLIICVNFFPSSTLTEPLPVKKHENEKCRIISKFQKFFGDDRISDVTFTLDCGTTLKASRILLMSQSDYFEKMLNGNWLEGQQSIISIKDVSYSTFYGVVYYAYYGKLEEGLTGSELVDIYLKSEMWGIDELVEICRVKLVKMVDEQTWFSILKLGWQPGDKLLKSTAIDYVVKNWEQVKESAFMKEFLKIADIEWIEEIMFARFFGINLL